MKIFNINSQKLIFYLVMIILFPALILTVAYNIYTYRSLTNDFITIGEEHVTALQTELDEKTSLIDSYLVNEATSIDFSIVSYQNSDLFERNLSLSNIISRFTQKIQDIPEIAALFIISDNFCRDRYNSYLDYVSCAALKDYAKNFLTTAPSSAKWTHCNINEKDYFVQTYNKQNCQMVCFFSIDQLYKKCLSGIYEEHICIFTDSADRNK